MKRIVGWLMAGLMSGAVQAADLRVNVENLQSDKGKIIIKLVNRHMYEAEDDAQVLQRRIVATRVPAVSYTFRELPPGEYALQVVHDLNSNHEFDYNVFTGPSEPFGVSRIRWAEADNLPDWQQVKFTLNEPVFSAKPVTMTVTLNE